MTPHCIGKLYQLALPLLIATCCVGCGPEQDPAPKSGTIEYRVAQIGEATVAAYYPKYDRKRFPVRIRQEKDRWVFNYRLPEGAFGGTPTVEIDKKTLKVVDVYQPQ